MIRRGAAVHERLGNDGEARVHDVRLVNVKDEVRILDQVDPEPQGQQIALPRVHDLRIGDLMVQRLVVQKVEHVLDGQRQGRAPVRCAEYRLEQIVDELLQRALRGQQPRQVDLRHHFVAPLALLLRVGVVVLDQVPDLQAAVVVVIEGRGGARQGRTGRAEFTEIQGLVLVGLVVLLREY